MSRPVIYWFRHDLRLTDLPGLIAAAATGPVIPVFIYDEQQGGDWAIGGASQWWLHHSLKDLADAIAALGGKLILRRGDTVTELTRLIEESGAAALFASRQYQPWADALERAVLETASELGASFKRYPGTLLFEPGEIVTGGGTPFKVFTPFWRACLKATPPAQPQPVPDIRFVNTEIASEELETLNLLPAKPNWAKGWENLWTPGERGAEEALNGFLAAGVGHYGEGRDFPSRPYTSRLSPFLKFGEISPRQVFWAAQHAKRDKPANSGDIDKFISELGWREFCNHLLALFPEMPDRAFNPKFEYFPWAGQVEHLKAWQQGQTGYPIVDAGMRELWQTGFMHNRVRMVVASFLTKHLLSHWRLGELWFWDCLLDADLASNACSWQWVAGSGADAAPYFRVFNPVAQGEKFDKEGEYTRKWVPEIAKLPNKYLHKPWEAPAMMLEAAGIKLGKTYPLPIVDHKQARESALAAYGTLKTIE